MIYLDDWVMQLQAVGLVALAGLLGGVIGLEREIADKPAGLRTHIFVAAASALFMVLGQIMIYRYSRDLGEDVVVAADPVRIMQAVVVGISFLGAGTIIQSGRSRVEGLTTAASVLLTAGLGLTVAMGEIVLAVCVTAMAVIVLVGLGVVTRRLHPKSREE